MKPLSILPALLLASVASMSATPSHAEVGEPEHPEASPFIELPEIAVTAQFMALRTAAISQGKRMLVIFGANWCHDSRGLAGALDTPRFKPLVEANFVVLYVDAGTPQEDKGRNLDLAASLGVPDIEGTPNLLVIDPVSGALINTPESARSWRNAASRSADEIFDELSGYGVDPIALATEAPS